MRQKNTEVPSGAAIADRSASCGPRSRGSSGASSCSARWAERIGSALSTAIAATRGPGSAGSAWLTRMWVSPWRQSCTSFVRWWPACRNPIAISSRSTLDARSEATASSANAYPRKGAAAGSADRPVASSSRSSDRIASTAMRFGSAWRKTSLKTSSESGPAYPAATTCSRNDDSSKPPWPGKQR